MTDGSDIAAVKYVADWGWLAISGAGDAPDLLDEIGTLGPWRLVRGTATSIQLDEATREPRPLLREQRQYVVTVLAATLRRLTWGWDATPLRALSRGEQALYQLDTGNSVGISQLVAEFNDDRVVTIPFRIANRKLEADEDFNWLVGELARSVRAIALTMISPTRLPTARTSRERSLGYEDLVFLSSVVRDVERTVERIAARPHRKLEYRSEWRELGSAGELDPGSLGQLVGAGHFLRKVDPPTHERVLPARARPRFRTAAGALVLPVRLPVRTREVSYDTFENRFVRHVLEQFGGRARAITQAMQVHDDLRHALEARDIEGRCRAMLRQPFLAEVGRLNTMQATSQVLLRDDAYNRILRTYQEFLLSSDVHWEGLRQAQENRDVAELYEMWVYMEVVRALQTSLGGTTSPPEQEQPVLMATAEGLVVSLRRDSASAVRIRGADGTVATAYYNRSFPARRGTVTSAAKSYSLPLRPDVVVELSVAGGRRYVVFDAKYRIEQIGTAFAAIEDDDASTSAASPTFKAADVHKMHAYRDAIDDVIAAIAVYPGPEANASLYPRVGFTEHGGVGAVPLRPGKAVRRRALQRAMRLALRSGPTGLGTVAGE